MTGLEALKNIKIRCHPKVVWDDPIDSDLDTIEKSLKALEIIKKKEVSVRLLKSSYTLLEYYTKYKSRTGCNTELTEEEFSLLKEVLE